MAYGGLDAQARTRECATSHIFLKYLYFLRVHLIQSRITDDRVRSRRRQEHSARPFERLRDSPLPSVAIRMVRSPRSALELFRAHTHPRIPAKWGPTFGHFACCTRRSCLGVGPVPPAAMPFRPSRSLQRSSPWHLDHTPRSVTPSCPAIRIVVTRVSAVARYFRGTHRNVRRRTFLLKDAT
jgi:hypothetical protein